MLLGEQGDRRRGRAAQLGRPFPPVVAEAVHQRRPGGELGEAAALPAQEVVEGHPPCRAQAVFVDDPQRLGLRRPDRVALDQLLTGELLLQLGLQLGDPGAGTVVEVGVLRHHLRPDVERVHVAARVRKVRGRLQRRRRLRRVQRVDQHEAGELLGRRPGGEVGEVEQVADAPGVGGGDAVQLGCVAPGPLVPHRCGEAEEGRAHHQRRFGLAGLGRRLQPVVAEWQVCGQLERRLPGEDAVDPACRLLVLDLRYVPPAALLEPDGEAHPLPVGQVHVHPARGALLHHDAGLQQAGPGPLQVGFQRSLCLVGVGCVDVHPGEDGDHGLVGHLGEATLPVPELGGDPESRSELTQELIGQGHSRDAFFSSGRVG